MIDVCSVVVTRFKHHVARDLKSRSRLKYICESVDRSLDDEFNFEVLIDVGVAELTAVYLIRF